MNTSRQQYAPWGEDPDPPQPYDEAKFRKGLKESLRKEKERNEQARDEKAAR